MFETKEILIVEISRIKKPRYIHTIVLTVFLPIYIHSEEINDEIKCFVVKVLQILKRAKKSLLVATFSGLS